MIDRLGLRGELPTPTSINFMRWVRRAFYDEMPEEFRYIDKPDGAKVEIVPGEFRMSAAHDVAVGRPQPPSSDSVVAYGVFFRSGSPWRKSRPAYGSSRSRQRITASITSTRFQTASQPFARMSVRKAVSRSDLLPSASNLCSVSVRSCGTGRLALAAVSSQGLLHSPGSAALGLCGEAGPPDRHP
jgi:hypothetical protein